jgi:Arc/MetJ family transcription regulator
MSRTNVDVDDELIARIMRRYRVTTKREAIDLALRELVGHALTTDETLQLEGSGWEGDLEALRATRPVS